MERNEKCQKEIRPDMTAALADLRELGDLSRRFGVELIRCLTSIAEGVSPVLLCEVSDVPAIGADHAVAHFKLTEGFQRCLAALRAWDGDLHVGHREPLCGVNRSIPEITPAMIKAGADILWTTPMDYPTDESMEAIAGRIYVAMTLARPPIDS